MGQGAWLSLSITRNPLRRSGQAISDSGGRGRFGERIIDLLQHFDNHWTRASELLVALLGRRGDWADVVNQHHDPQAAEAILADTVSDLTSVRLKDAIDRLGSHLDALIPALNEARERLGKNALAVTTDATSLPDWHAVIGVLLTTQHNWRKPRGINATLGFPPVRTQTSGRFDSRSAW